MREALCLLSLLWASEFSAAAEISSTIFKDGKARIDLVGEIVPGDARAFRAEIQKANDANRLVATVRLNSAGGNLLESVEIAEMVRKGRIATSVLSNAQCASACFVIFAAGQEKYASYQAQIGVHGASDETGRETTYSNAATVGMARVAKELGVPAGIIGKMVVTPPDKMVWLTVDDLRSMETKMFGKPDQLASEESPSRQSQLPSNDQQVPRSAESPQAKRAPTWTELVDGAIALSSSQNNGKPRYVRSCQPELKVCTMGIYYLTKERTQAFVKVTEDLAGKIIEREVCNLNKYNDVRECLEWSTNALRKDMKNARGDWYEVERK